MPQWLLVYSLLLAVAMCVAAVLASKEHHGKHRPCFGVEQLFDTVLITGVRAC